MTSNPMHRRPTSPAAPHDDGKQAHEARRLSVLELEGYIRVGCTCSVCDFARSEINAQREAAYGFEGLDDRPPVWSTDSRRGHVAPISRIGLAIHQFKSTLMSWREALGGRARSTRTD